MKRAPRTLARKALIISICAGCVALAGCAGGGSGSGSTSTPAPSPTAQSPSSPTGSPSPSSSGQPSEGATYSSRAFIVPLTVKLSPALEATSVTDSEHLLTWDAAENDNNKVRFLSPVEVYPPTVRGEGQSPSAPPKDYSRYVMSLGKFGGVKITNVEKITVGGRPATLMTLTNTGGEQSGSLGCPARADDPGEDCFGIQPDFKVRFAVMKSGPPLAIWARTDAENPDEAFLTSFEQMLGTVRFR
jgi:hypothetical protein